MTYNKKIVEKLVISLGKTLSFIYTQNFLNKVSYIHSLLFYGWIERKFKHLGKVYFKIPAYIGGSEYMEIHDGTCVGRRVMLQATNQYGGENFFPQIMIGNNCNIGDDSNIQCCNSIKIGDGVRLGRKVMINDTSHGTFSRNQLDIQPNKRPLMSKGPIVIDDNVWIGEMVCILGNVHIGKGAVIGAGSIVTKDIPPYSLAVGSPAKVIKSFEENLM